MTGSDSQSDARASPADGAGRRVARVVAMAALVVVTLAWVGSRVLTDRVGSVQLAWWVPTWVYLAGALVGIVVLWRMVTRRTRLGFVVLVLLMVGYWLGPEWRMHTGPHRVFGAYGEPTVRVVFWNTWEDPQTGLVDPSIGEGADVVILANSWRSDAPEVLRESTGLGSASIGRFLILSDCEILEVGSTQLGFTTRHAGAQPGEPGAVDSGAAAYVILAPGPDSSVTAFPDGGLVVWMLDLPSSPSLSRVRAARQAREVIERYAGERGDGAPGGFPAPDLIVGDFNIPRRSASLGLIAPGTRDAGVDTTGALVGTWPRRTPVLWIDHARLGDRVRAITYEAMDPGTSRHRAIGVDVQAVR